MSLHRRAFLANFAGATAGVTAGIALASTPDNAPGRRPADPVVIEDSFPAFSLDEYAKIRELMLVSNRKLGEEGAFTLSLYDEMLALIDEFRGSQVAHR